MAKKEKPLSKMTADDLTKEYVGLRDKRAALKAAYEDADEQLKERMGTLETQMLKMLNKTGAENMKTGHGTMYTTVQRKPSVSDWEAVYDFIREHDAFDMLEKRVKIGFINEYMENNDEELPPGVTVFSERKVNVRR